MHRKEKMVITPGQEDAIELIAESADLIIVETSGYSMWPFLLANTRLLIKKPPRQDLRIGDLILYQKEGSLVCHRLVKISFGEKESLFFARADNTLFRSSLECVTAQMLKGRVAAVLHKNKAIDLTSARQKLINRFLAEFAPQITWFLKLIQPVYKRCDKFIHRAPEK